jgi:PAS domain S-box-containing protein
MPERVAEFSHEQARALLSVTRELLAIVSAKGEFLFINDSFGRVLGYAPEDLLGKPLTSLHPPAEAQSLREKFAALVAEHGPGAGQSCATKLANGAGSISSR